jgi:excisionase family DNA binding protein
MSQPHADVPPEAESELLTAVELARWLHITPRTVYRFVRNAQLPYVRVGRARV